MAEVMTAIRSDTPSNQCESTFESFVEKCMENFSSSYDELTIIPAGFDVTRLNTYRKKLIGIVKKQCVRIISTPKSYYSDSLFFLSYGLHRIPDERIERAVLLGCDIAFRFSAGANSSLSSYFILL
ncbi:hypothetical protein GQX74_010715 [Glossina fuscipes]|nr:hypothetical protein GQX74_010715 [Glossina fuscipes]